jgi:hypothetical protein
MLGSKRGIGLRIAYTVRSVDTRFHYCYLVPGIDFGIWYQVSIGAFFVSASGDAICHPAS